MDVRKSGGKKTHETGIRGGSGGTWDILPPVLRFRAEGTILKAQKLRHQ